MNQNIYQWIARAQQGEEAAALLILQQFRPLICKYARRHRYCYDSLDEALSTAHLAVLECIYSFDLDDEAKAVETAIEKVLQEGYRTTDIMSPGKTLVSTSQMGDLIVNHL